MLFSRGTLVAKIFLLDFHSRNINRPARLQQMMLLGYNIVAISLRGQIAHFVNCARIPQHAKFIFVSKITTSLLFSDLLAVWDSTSKQFKNCSAINCSKFEFANTATTFAKSGIICGNYKKIFKMCIIK